MRVRYRRLLALAGLSVAMLAVSGCIGNRMQWPEQSVIEDDGYSLAFIELDDQGELWAPSQVVRALERIEGANTPAAGAVVVVYVHGWNHDAQADDANVQGFREQLARIVAGERVRPASEQRKVVGVYMGWRGKISKILPINMMSFYSRRGAAERIASLATTETIYRLMTDAKRNRRTRVVLIGHSFGGMILETVLSQALVGFLLQHEESVVEFPADLVFLLNPASQSIRAKQFVEILARQRLRLYRTDEDDSIRLERPLIVSMTSAGDAATGFAFPLGVGVKGLLKSYRSYGSEYCNAATSQRRYYRRTPGHIRELLSHRVFAEPLAEPRDRPLSLEDMAAGVDVRYDPLSRVQSFIIAGTRMRFTIQRRAGAFNDTPYWIMRVPTSVMPDHGHIFGAELQELMRAVIVITGALEPDSRTLMIHEDGVRPLGIARMPNDAMGVLFLDRSRRIYAVSPGIPTRFFACLPAPAAAVENSLGFSQSGRTVYLGRRTPEAEDGASERIDVIRMQLLDDDTLVDQQMRIDPREPVAAISFDVRGKRAFLASVASPRIDVASLSAKRTKTESLLSVSGLSGIAQLLYEPSGDQLFATDGVGTVVRVALGAGKQRSEVVARDLSFPTAMTFDAERNRLYVATRGHRVWQIACTSRCTEPELFAETDQLVNPTSLLVTGDGIVWVGDSEAENLLCFSPAGELFESHNRLPRL